MPYSADNIADIAEQIRVNGFAVIEEGLPPDRVVAMRDRFDELMAAKVASEPFNRGSQRFQMYLPWEPPFADPLLYEDERVLAVLEAVLGSDPALQYFASDTPLPGSEHQRVHSDTRLLFPEAQLSLPCYGIALNVPLVDCTEENGSLEFWPGGTHFSPVGTDLDRLAAFLPSSRANLKAGSFLLRDLRMWHRGTPNRSNRSRPHLALVYTRSWCRFEQRAPSLSRAAFEGLSKQAKKLLRYAEITT